MDPGLPSSATENSAALPLQIPESNNYYSNALISYLNDPRMRAQTSSIYNNVHTNPRRPACIYTTKANIQHNQQPVYTSGHHSPVVTYRAQSNSLSDIYCGGEAQYSTAQDNQSCATQSNTSTELYSSTSPVGDNKGSGGSTANKVPLLFPQHFLPTVNTSAVVGGPSSRPPVTSNCYHIGTLPRSLHYYSQKNNRNYPMAPRDEASILLQPLLQTKR